jgi:hypothetical protein
MFVNIIDSYRYVVAICDKELIGKTFEEGEYQLDIKENFYKGEIKSEAEVIKIIKDMSAEDATFNIVGERSVQTAIKSRIISENSVLKIQGIPYAMVLL